MICTWAAATHLGFGPEINQDRMHPAGSGRSSEPVAIMVADGLGGEKFGHVSAELAVTHRPGRDRIARRSGKGRK